MKKKICFFSAYFHPHFGGVERYTHQLAKEFIHLGYDVFIVTFNTNNSLPNEEFDGIKIIRVPVYEMFKNRFPVQKFNSSFFKIIKNLKNSNFDYIITNTRFYLTTVIALKVASRHKKKLLIIDHGSGHMITGFPIIDFLGENYEHFISCYLRKRNTAFYGVSEAVCRWLEHFNIKAEGVVYNSIDVNYKTNHTTDYKTNHQIPENATLFAFAGRLINEKGILVLCNAFKELTKVYTDIYLIIAGDGPLLEEIKTTFESRQIIVLGKIKYEEVIHLLEQADVTVIPSFYPEGLPTLLLEAGISNCAVITTSQGGTREVIPDNNYGVFIEPRSVDDIKKAIVKLLEDTNYKTLIAKNLHNRVKDNFSWKYTALKFEKNFKNI